MKCVDIFGLFVRCVGVMLSLIGLNQLYRAVIMMAQGAFGAALVPLVSAVPASVLGLWFLRGASSLVSFSYPPEEQEK